MKIVIDIPEDVYKHCRGLRNSLYNDNSFHDTAKFAIGYGIPLDDIKAEIREEKEFAYADFEQYKVDFLNVDPEYVEDELPNDEFRYGMERCLEIIDRHTGKEQLNDI